MNFQAIKCIISDVDGVMTGGELAYSAEGESHKVFHAQDGSGIVQWLAHHYQFAVISGRSHPAVNTRMGELGVRDVFQKVADKQACLTRYLQDQGYTLAQICYIGDDLPDLGVIKQVGLGVAVANAISVIKTEADIVTRRSGGQGAVGELCRLLLKRKGHLVE
jgi:3-deoxy-D-manno-octulosonate 8-phosphate phosphatase (KDO 8-P phosphatase)